MHRHFVDPFFYRSTRFLEVVLVDAPESMVSLMSSRLYHAAVTPRCLRDNLLIFRVQSLSQMEQQVSLWTQLPVALPGTSQRLRIVA